MDGDGLPAALESAWFNSLATELIVSGLPLNSHSNAAEKLHQVKAGPGILFGFNASTSLATAQWIQVHDTHDAPTSGAVPVATFQINGAATTTGNDIAVSYIFPGRFFLYGIWLANSTARTTYTAGAADTFFDAQFI